MPTPRNDVGDTETPFASPLKDLDIPAIQSSVHDSTVISQRFYLYIIGGSPILHDMGCVFFDPANKRINY